MVTKPCDSASLNASSSVLAKILMVTKLTYIFLFVSYGSVLAKILMVTKPTPNASAFCNSSVLAKILMVTKLIELLQYS